MSDKRISGQFRNSDKKFEVILVLKYFVCNFFSMIMTITVRCFDGI